MVQISGTTITMTRGDTARLSVFITDSEGEGYTPGEQDTIRFAMKKDFKEGDPLLLINIPVDTMMLVINPEDTKSLPFGSYVYDIELTTEAGVVDTFIDRAKLKLTEEVH